jgi:hypothetical protein
MMASISIGRCKQQCAGSIPPRFPGVARAARPSAVNVRCPAGARGFYFNCTFRKPDQGAALFSIPQFRSPAVSPPSTGAHCGGINRASTLPAAFSFALRRAYGEQRSRAEFPWLLAPIFHSSPHGRRGLEAYSTRYVAKGTIRCGDRCRRSIHTLSLRQAKRQLRRPLRNREFVSRHFQSCSASGALTALARSQFERGRFQCPKNLKDWQ